VPKPTKNSTAPPQVPLLSPLDFTSFSGAPKLNGPVSVRVACQLWCERRETDCYDSRCTSLADLSSRRPRNAA
jgi:hypothetical protein